MNPTTLTVNGNVFQVVKLLGKGKGGYSWLVERDGSLFVLKQIHHEPCDYYQFGDKLQSELQDYERLKSIGISIPKLLDVDIPNERILKEYISGETIMELVKQDRTEAWHVEQVRQMCRLLYAAHANIDYFPTNFIPQEGLLYYIDYECNDYMEQWDFEHWGSKYWSKTPEFLMYLEEHG